MIVLNVAVVLVFLAVALYVSFFVWTLPKSPVPDVLADGFIPVEETDLNGEGVSIKDEIPFKIVALAYLSLLAGMVSIVVYKALRQAGAIELSRFSIECAVTALVSPIVFRTMLSTTPNLRTTPWYVIVLTGYQNGFFWQSIFGQIFSSLSLGE